MSREGLLYQLVTPLHQHEPQAFFLDPEQNLFHTLEASAAIPPALPHAHAKDDE